MPTTVSPPRQPPLKRLFQKLTDAHSRHRERHRPTGHGFVLADRLAYLNRDDWDQLTASASIFMRRGYLETLERHRPDNLTPRYAVIYREQTPVAAVSAQIVSVSAQHFTRKKALPGLKEQCLVCGNLLSWGPHGVAFAAGEDPTTLWPAVAEALYRIRRAERLSGQTDFIMVKDFPVAESPASLARFSYRPIETEPNMVLELKPEWRTQDDYLGSLQGNYKKSAQRMHRDLAKAGCNIETVTNLAQDASRIHSLYLQVHENAEVKPVTLPAMFFPALASALSDSFRCTLIKKDDTVLGFATTIKDGDTAVCYYLGFDRTANAELPIYVRLLHANVADGIALGCRRLSLGRTALEAKARLGAKPVPLQVWVRHRQPLVNFFFRSLLQHVRHDEPPERNPFKEN